MYKSYADPLILHYITYHNNLELGFTFGNYEDSPKIGFVENLLKKLGTVLIRRDPKTSASRLTTKIIDPNIMSYVNAALFSDVVENNTITTIFQNDERIRSGKFTIPQTGEMSTRLLFHAYKKLNLLKYDIKVVPVCITYERLFEASYLSNEMVSGQF